MVNSAFNDFIGVDSTKLWRGATGNELAGHLLWGDGIVRLGSEQDGRVKVTARGKDREGWVDAEALGGKSLLEVYFIDVGQGDGVLVKTPDFQHLMIDGGHSRTKQNTGKSAADFVDWKFTQDYGMDRIQLEAMIASHNDLDHYGGLADLLDAGQTDELDAKSVTVENFYHAGISWWRKDGKRTLGTPSAVDGKEYRTQLLEDRESALKATDINADVPLQGEWGKFIKKVVSAKRVDGSPTSIERLSHLAEHLPGFEPGGDVTMRLLGPVEFTIDGKPALPDFGSDSKTTNGNSVVLRIDYGRARILLTGDLNKGSQQTLMEVHAGRRMEFQCDVAKGCHHGSEDVSYAFLQAMTPAATVICSGDGEGHDHPRPRIVAASGVTGYRTIENDEILTPLVYSTELARSVSIGSPTSLDIKSGAIAGVDEDVEIDSAHLQQVTVRFTETKPGALNPERKQKPMSRTPVVAGLIYGLVNVRTDGETILCATMNEGDGSWAVKKFKSRF
ncbi:ComEC/Rec2 family competence protein [Neorhizobium tomejilense]|uniref:ComEC/Rec2 family competence protein n=1 Tax=Neorhizobium tomejilense TaxID=2093828 RepID=UPI000CF8732D|nr:MBL fold metallo-hydrolase [Neorhizobium tomejilense]